MLRVAWGGSPSILECQLGRPRMAILRYIPAGLLASGVVLGLLCPGGTARAEPVANEVMLVNAKTDKCLTIAGGVSPNNNVTAIQFSCDNDQSRRWTIRS